MKQKIAIIILLALAAVKLPAQNTLTLPANLTHCYQGGTRSENGQPGKAYWQNRADYDITVDFDPTTRALKGTVTIDYTNNSPDTLKRLLFKLYPNLYQAQAPREVTVAAQDLGDGVRISELTIDGRKLDSTHQKTKSTNMQVTGMTILPHSQVHLIISYSYTLNKSSFIRTGQIDSGSFFIAYFFPRIAVYDDIDGWNEYPYTGRYEFYNDYGDFKLAINVPSNYLVWSTGDLQNKDSVYPLAIRNRLQTAEKSDSLIDIITQKDLPTSTANHHWLFTAKNVTDVAFAVSNHYCWRATSRLVDPSAGRRTRIDAVYSPAHPEYNKVTSYAAKTVDLIDKKLPNIPFPYSHITVVDGLDAMEYPMMVNDLPFDKPADAIEFTAHEVFHSLFPFYVGTNETKYSWMDEGLATLTEFVFHPLIDSTIPVGNNTGDVNRSAGTEQDLPIMTLTPQLMGAARYSDKDMKPALGFYYLREMLGEQTFNQALRWFITNWAGKHPTPYDFFNCMNTGSATNLNWFWTNWFFYKYIPDLAIINCEAKGIAAIVTIERKGEGMVPVHLTVTYKDGTIIRFTRTIQCWATGSRRIKLTIPAAKPIRSIVLGDPFDADSDPSNNHWPVH